MNEQQIFDYIMNEQQIFESIICKFLINLPLHQLKDSTRLSFHCQKAYYYYIDQLLPNLKNKSLLNRQQFFNLLQLYSQNLKKNKSISPLTINSQLLLSKLAENKPVCGAIIFNSSETKVVVIKAANKFGFPKGKWNEQQKAQQCAAREVKQQIGLYIHNKILANQKVQFLSSRQQTLTIFFIVKGINQSQKFTIDKNQIDDVFWMKVQDVNRMINRFASKSKDAWKLYLNTNYSIPKIDDFIKQYCPSNANSNKNQFSFNNFLENPLLNFKFDTQKLMKVFK